MPNDPNMVWHDDNPNSNSQKKKGLKAPIGSPGYEHVGSKPGPPKPRTGSRSMQDIAKDRIARKGRGG